MKLCNERLQQLGNRLELALTREKNNKNPFNVYKRLIPGKDVFPQQRDQAVLWIMRLCDKFHFYPETFALSINILDRVLSSVKVNPRYLQCIVTTSLYLAAKLLEENEVVPGTLEFVRSTQCGCTVSEVLRMERVILDKLQWQINSSTALDFLHIFHTMLLSSNPQLFGSHSHLTPAYQLSALTTKLKFCLAHHQLVAFRPSTLALAVLSLEMESYTGEWFSLTCYLQHLAQIDSRRLIHCREAVASCLSSSQYKKNVVYRFSLEAVNKRVKRSLSESDDDPNIYDGIKRLYNSEDGGGGAMSCGLAARCGADDTPCPTLKPVEVN
ncbi:cyclin-I-like [Tubulanus polymorphus]|uniref:cyclin-I-like n=1 Tax=Tubulanus polymorphus TaxID=672921 RepID=UPI003DA5F9C4